MTNITNPQHYTKHPIQPIEVIEAWGLNFNTGNAIKYIARYLHKGTPTEDLDKAIWYLQREKDNIARGVL